MTHRDLRAVPRTEPLDVDTVDDDELFATWQLFRRAVHVVDARLSATLTGTELDNQLQYETLHGLAVAPHQQLSMSTLARWVGVTSGSLTKIVDRLESDALLVRRHSREDRRVVYAVLTDAGAAVASHATPSYAGELRSELAHLGSQRLAALRVLCDQLLRELPATDASSDRYETLVAPPSGSRYPVVADRATPAMPPDPEHG